LLGFKKLGDKQDKQSVIKLFKHVKQEMLQMEQILFGLSTLK